MKRCGWARSPAMIDYHDREWGVPAHDDRVLFEFITLEGAQAGLSWEDDTQQAREPTAAPLRASIRRRSRDSRRHGVPG